MNARAHRPWLVPVGLAAACMAVGVAIGPAAGQGLNLGRGSSEPVEILARNGIEWDRPAQRYTARGDARATQGDTVVEADELIAHYRQRAEGSTEIYRLEATGRVRISTPTQRALADKGIYDTDSGVLVLTGKTLKLTTPGEEITARDSLEYWEAKQLAVARGNAMVVTGDKRIRGDVLTSYFVNAPANAPPPARPVASGQVRPGAARTAPAPSAARPASAAPGSAAAGEQRRLQRIEAFGNVHVSSPVEVARGERGVYNAETGIAVLSGAVRMTRGESQLNGDYAEVNLNTGISRLLSRPAAGSDGRVRALLTPQDQRPGQNPAGPQR